MCGIVGFTNRKKHNEGETIEVLHSMMEKIQHRGPDGNGVYVDEQISLGHQRLAIIDLEQGAQPMKNKDGTVVCVFNGEIYNFHGLRKELMDKGYIFQTNSDTEVFVHGWEEWKRELPKKLRGMFAFAIWDTNSQELFCARDHFGIKPFYYYHANQTFLFGSEIKSFLSHPDFKKELNQEQLELYLTYQYSPGENTFFQNVYKLLPGHYLMWKAGEIEIERYWTPYFVPNKEKTLSDWAWEIDLAMADSMRAHKISDVEVGSFLSSGIDSSYITRVSEVKKTFTVGFEHEKYNESNFAKSFSERIGCENKTYNISPEEFWNKLPQIQYYMDEPLADASAAALYFLNREAAKEVKVCLSGEGADELFGGYKIYKEPFMCQKYDALPMQFRCILGKIAELLPPMPGVNFLVRHGRPLEERYIGNTMLFSEREKKQLLKSYTGKVKPVDISKPYYGKLQKAGAVTRMQYTDLHLWLVGDILLKADKMSMANSLEVRVPFLDRKVFEVARQLPTEYRVNGKETKIALRHAAEFRVGRKCAKREKWGFPVPVRAWLKEEVHVAKIRKEFQSDIAGKFFQKTYLEKLLVSHQSGKRDCWREIWAVYMFLLWYQEYFGVAEENIANDKNISGR